MTMSSNVQRVPAWKRLGLKLKGQPTAAPRPADDGTPAVGQPGGGAQQQQHQRQTHSTKRKLDAPPATEPSLGVIKKPRREGQLEGSSPLSYKKPKSVSFADSPSQSLSASDKTHHKTLPTPHQLQQQKQVKKAKGPPKKQKPMQTADLTPALEYLRLWKSDRGTWKFNKNHQSTLIKNAFDPSAIPASDITLFYDYVCDLKGFVRSRLHDAAMELRNSDASLGALGFPQDTPDVKTKQVSYEQLLTDLLRKSQPTHKRKEFNEADFVATTEDDDVVISRVVKRMRAELIIDELSDGEQTDDSRTTQSSETISASDVTMAPTDNKGLQVNDGAAKRRRKLRVNMDDSSSSESESASDSETSSESSSQESDDDDDDDEADSQADEDDSSSSSSSSSSDEESEEDESSGSESDES
ncbi:hypothetical protein CDD81_61 [Ophiocordyceps australis]|uniref:WKF domain-containing protein n=1 Tax=Ophiocordyceps australis TaxID=1399860 RepID=A0A2C5XNH6_9HYPO|nr:hypothetical protein CDD81_61 [Ophiocordyceps australis]